MRPDATACEPNETGELLVSGRNVMAGYWDRADATGDAFRKGSYDPIVEACLPLAGKCTGTGSRAVGDHSGALGGTLCPTDAVGID